jgi:polyisoprenyl-teichoic acid--peptidoglycan teichoic acid transferase
MVKNKKKKKGRLTKIILIELLVIVLLFLGFKVYSMMGKIQHEDNFDKDIEQNENVNISGYRNIALFGGDSRSNTLQKGTHSDTIIIASINNKTKDVKLASVYRDTYVNIPGEGYSKINSAYFKGGYSLALSTLNRNLDLDIKEYVTVNFKAVVKVIDLLGGITLDVQPNELKYLNGYVRELNRINGTDVKGLPSAGTQLVNGTQATAYARIRYTSGGDFKRTERQRIVVQKIFDKVKHSDLATLQKVMNEIFPNISTNLSNTELLGLASDVLSYDIVEQTGFPFEKEAHTYNKVSYVFPIDLDANVKKLHEFLFDEVDYVPTQTVKDTSIYVENIRTK